MVTSKDSWWTDLRYPDSSILAIVTQAGWLGHYSLSEQGVNVGDFEDHIAENAPLTFTDPKVRLQDLTIIFAKVDPYICGHRGHAMVSCGNRFSTGFRDGAFAGEGDNGPGF